MPYRMEPLETGSFYHVFNRGVNKLDIFIDDRDYNQAKLAMNFYRFTKPSIKLSRFKTLTVTEQSRFTFEILNSDKTLVDILCYVFMPNHFHFILKQNVDGGISKFVGQFTNSYARYFNTSHKWVGHLFQGQFKTVEITTEEQLLHVSRYIHLNPLVAGIANKTTLKDYQWSSYPDYLRGKSNLVKVIAIPRDYEGFVLGHADYASKLEYVKHFTLDSD